MFGLKKWGGNFSPANVVTVARSGCLGATDECLFGSGAILANLSGLREMAAVFLSLGKLNFSGDLSFITVRNICVGGFTCCGIVLLVVSNGFMLLRPAAKLKAILLFLILIPVLITFIVLISKHKVAGALLRTSRLSHFFNNEVRGKVRLDRDCNSSHTRHHVDG